MTTCWLSRGFALSLAAALSGCGVRQEVPERCIERFGKLLADDPHINGGDLRDMRFQPIFTYDITHMEDVFETIYGDAAGAAGARMTVSHGAGGAALETFYKEEVPAKGAMFAADDFTLYRVRGTPGSRGETLAAGCRGAHPKARLVHIQWIALPPATEGQPGPELPPPRE